MMDIDKTLELHNQWLLGKETGVYADLRSADLSGADLHGAKLPSANLSGVNLCDADLNGANLCDADLCDADLNGANLCDADLWGANLSGADLSGAELNWVNWHEVRGLFVYSAQLQSSRSNAQLTYIPSLDVATTGCWQDTWQATKDRVDEVYKDTNQQIYQAYQLAFNYIEAQMKLSEAMEGKCQYQNL